MLAAPRCAAHAALLPPPPPRARCAATCCASAARGSPRPPPALQPRLASASRRRAPPHAAARRASSASSAASPPPEPSASLGAGATPAHPARVPPPPPPPPPLPRAPPQRGPPLAPGHTLELPIRGVTFEGRQAAVRALAPEEPLLFVREPENASDTDAVAICTLAGAPLGYVPRQLTWHFGEDTALGRVADAGENERGIAWALAHAKPAGPALTSELCPAGAPARMSADEAALAPPQEARACCACGGAGAAAQPVWRYDAASRTATLRRMAPLCAPCATARQLGGGEGDSASRAQLAAVNGWTEAEADAYVGWVQRERARRAALGAWRTDTSWLSGQRGAAAAEAEAPPSDDASGGR
jgi:hypothetical protein